MFEDIKGKLLQPVKDSVENAVKPETEKLLSILAELIPAAKKTGNNALVQVAPARVSCAYQKGIWDCKRNICNPPTSSDEEHEAYLRGYNEEYAKQENKGILKHGFLWAGLGFGGGILVARWWYRGNK